MNDAFCSGVAEGVGNSAIFMELLVEAKIKFWLAGPLILKRNP